ncbi:MAG: hypothetical protein ACYDCO_09685 [Armatimonadota bacterium]
MKCPRCQTDNPMDAQICRRCGAGLPSGAPAAPVQPAPSSTAGSLLGCLIITAILAAIILPVFARARTKVKMSSCMSHQRRLAIGLLSYAQDNDETLPLPEHWVESSPYLSEDPRVFDCPSTSHEGIPKEPDYGMNGLLFEHDSKTGTRVGVPLANINTPANVLLLADSGDAAHLLNSEADIDKRHEGKCIAAYADGHVSLEEQITFPKKYTEF